MINYTFTNDDVQFVERAIEVKNKGWYMDGAQLTQVYNRVLHKNANVTNCGSCIRQRICELETALNHFKQKMANEAISSPSESVSHTEVDSTPHKENKELTEAEIMKERMAKVRAARKDKK